MVDWRRVVRKEVVSGEGEVSGDTTFLFGGERGLAWRSEGEEKSSVRKALNAELTPAQRDRKDSPIRQQHSHIHSRHDKDDMEPTIVVPRSRAFIVVFVRRRGMIVVVFVVRFVEDGGGEGAVHSVGREGKGRAEREKGGRRSAGERAKRKERSAETHPSATAAIKA